MRLRRVQALLRRCGDDAGAFYRAVEEGPVEQGREVPDASAGWRTSGHPSLAQLGQRRSGGALQLGVVAGWLLSGEEGGELQEEQFWFVHHDGDAEDLDDEARCALASFRFNGCGEAVLQQAEALAAEEEGRPPPRRRRSWRRQQWS